jgi:hypothetical protein
MEIASALAEVAGFAWPVVVLVLVCLLFFTQVGRALLGSLRQVKLGQIQLELAGLQGSCAITRVDATRTPQEVGNAALAMLSPVTTRDKRR